MSDESGDGASKTTDPAAGSSTGTDVDLRSFVQTVVEALDRRTAELRAADARFQEERDRRYTEVALEREKALKIKETADETARILVAQNQAYRDEKANELRAQIEGERGNYLSRNEYLATAKESGDRFSRLESFQSKMLGALALATVFVPALTGIVVYVLTR